MPDKNETKVKEMSIDELDDLYDRFDDMKEPLTIDTVGILDRKETK